MSEIFVCTRLVLLTVVQSAGSHVRSRTRFSAAEPDARLRVGDQPRVLPFPPLTLDRQQSGLECYDACEEGVPGAHN